MRFIKLTTLKRERKDVLRAGRMCKRERRWALVFVRRVSWQGFTIVLVKWPPVQDESPHVFLELCTL